MFLVIRLAMASMLLVGVYLETGPWTVTVLAFITVGLELLNLSNENALKTIEKIVSLLEKMNR